MALINLQSLRSAVQRGMLKYRTNEQLKIIRLNIRHFERLATDAYRGRDIVGFNGLQAKAENWRQAEKKHLAGLI